MSKFKGTKGKWLENKHAKGNIMGLDNRLVANCMGYSTNSDNGEHILESQANALLISKAPEMLEKLDSILHTSEEKGVAGCTWGDTDFDSESVAFGYNLALEHIKKGIPELLKSATDL